ncbi:hypothetical protein [Candidatus Accumulibacter sp. ACC003]|uniref:hypothetical protein n=1 Tax=Candidatus Accumulibacter sp. ACC003 TaxID=2823334 RepID=UPI0025C13535|nr:hypothetical protein [Candidatus Accumulibacter sp. ACC003]
MLIFVGSRAGGMTAAGWLVALAGEPPGIALSFPGRHRWRFWRAIQARGKELCDALRRSERKSSAAARVGNSGAGRRQQHPSDKPEHAPGTLKDNLRRLLTILLQRKSTGQCALAAFAALRRCIVFCADGGNCTASPAGAVSWKTASRHAQASILRSSAYAERFAIGVITEE